MTRQAKFAEFDRLCSFSSLPHFSPTVINTITDIIGVIIALSFVALSDLAQAVEILSQQILVAVHDFCGVAVLISHFTLDVLRQYLTSRSTHCSAYIPFHHIPRYFNTTRLLAAADYYIGNITIDLILAAGIPDLSLTIHLRTVIVLWCRTSRASTLHTL